MAKKAKKRNKKYTGQDAKQQRPVVHRYKAVERSKLGEWWQDNKKIFKPITIGTGIIALIIWLMFELVRIAS